MELLIDGKNAFSCNSQTIHEAFDVLRNVSKLLQQRAALKFYPGQRVSFQSKRGMKIIGQIDSINKVSISMHEIENPLHKWKVSPGLLKLESTTFTRNKK